MNTLPDMSSGPQRSQALRLLIVDDSLYDVEIIVHEIRSSYQNLTWKQVETAADMQAALEAEPWDVIISDYRMPHFDGLAALRLLQAKNLDIPFLLVSGTIGEDVAVAAMKGGAHDYLMKDNLSRLVPAIRREIEEASIRHGRKRSEERMSRLNDCFLKFGADSDRNIGDLASLCGQLLNASYSLYNRLEGEFLCAMGQWSTPADFKSGNKASGSPCYDVIRQENYQVLIIRNLQDTPYAKTDPNVTLYGLMTYMGHPIRCGRAHVGALSVVYQKDFSPTEDDKKLLGIIASAIGIEEERKAMQDDLWKHKAELEAALDELKRTQMQIVQQERLSALGQMASGIAHDFNNLLVPLVGFSELMLTDPSILKNEEEARVMLLHINTAANDGKELVKRLREFYRPDEGIERDNVDIAKLISEALMLTEPRWKQQAQAKGALITVMTETTGLPRVPCNRSQIREVFTNLIFNAVDAMPGGGKLTINAYLKKENVMIEIGDTGTGMSPEVLKRCFEPFFTTKGKKGTGLGLSMVYGVIQRHSGLVKIESGAGIGTRIIISLPLEIKGDGLVLKKPVVKTMPFKSLRVLAVDDEEWPLHMVRRFLGLDGHIVELAGNGREALEKLTAGNFDLVITDRAMPDMSGDQVAQAAKAMSSALPVIMLTGFGQIMKDEDEKPEGVDLILNKPMTREELVAAIEEVMAGKDK